MNGMGWRTDKHGVDIPLSEPLHMIKPTKFKWRAVLINPTFSAPPSFINRLRFLWGQDIWFGRWPVFKIQAALYIAVEILRWQL